MSKHDEHSIKEVRINGQKVTVVCDCKWKSKPAPSETKAKEEYTAHVEGS